MEFVKRSMAIFITILLFMSDMPMQARSETLDAKEGTTEVIQYNTGHGLRTVVTQIQGEEILEGNSDIVTGTAINTELPAGDKELIADDFFADDGSYTIQIPEIDPFFPYEMQFTYNGNVKNEWFMTPEDSVEIGGHTFYVAAEFTGSVITQMNMNVAGDMVAVYPAGKEFPEHGATGYSLLPLTERSLTMDLTGYTPMELSTVRIMTIFAGEKEFTDTDKIMWSYGDDDYTISTLDDIIDMRENYFYQMIVGNDDQLDISNMRYNISVSKTSMEDWLIASIYTQKENGERTEVIPIYKHIYIDDIYCTFSGFDDIDKLYIGLRLNYEKFPNCKFDHIKVYKGFYENLNNIGEEMEITNQIWEVDMNKEDSGYFLEPSQGTTYFPGIITFVIYDIEGQIAGSQVVHLNSYLYAPSFRLIDFLIYVQNQNGEFKSIQTNHFYDTTNEEHTVNIPGNEMKDRENVYLKVGGYDQLCKEFQCSYIGVYEGSYKTAEEAIASKNITNEIWSKKESRTEGGYLIKIKEGQNYYAVDITFVAFDTDDNVMWAHPLKLWIDFQYECIYPYQLENGKSRNIIWSSHSELMDDVLVWTWGLYSDYKIEDEYFQRFLYRDGCGKTNNDEVLGAYVGIYKSTEEAEAAGAADIKDILFNTIGYKADYSKGVYFTFFVQEETGVHVYHYKIIVQDGGKHENDVNNTIFLKFEGIKDAEGNDVNCYIVDANEILMLNLTI